MTDIEWLRIAAWPGFLAMTLAIPALALPLPFANGSRSILLCLFAAVLLLWTVAFGALYQAYNLTEINSTGTAYLFVWWVRIATFPVGVLFNIVGLHYWRRRHIKEH